MQLLRGGEPRAVLVESAIGAGRPPEAAAASTAGGKLLGRAAPAQRRPRGAAARPRAGDGAGELEHAPACPGRSE